MIGTALLIGGLILGAGLIAAFWREIQAWLQKVLEKLKVAIQGTVEGVRISFSKMQGAGKQISKNYVKVGMKWKETIVEKRIDVSEIPEEYRNKMINDNEQYDFTAELENQLQH